MAVSIFRKPVEVANRLGELGTSSKMLSEVSDALIGARAECTDNDPFGSRGWRGWQMGTRRLRELHVGTGDWSKDDTDQIPSIVSKSRGIRIVVCNTDDGTAVEGGEPQNYSKKGSATSRAVDVNQLSFMDQLDDKSKIVSIAQDKTAAGYVKTYYLCVYEQGDDRRAELSFPTRVENGYFSDFVERIFLFGGDSEPENPTRKPAADSVDSDYEIPVVRKKS